MGESADLPGDLRVVGGAAVAGAGDSGPGVLLGLYEGQPASAELHINKNKTKEKSLSRPTGNPRENGFNRNIYLFIQT